MSKFITLILLALSTLSFSAMADHQHHPKHNMILLGESTVFASHIVYKEPHNYQVLLQLAFEPQDQQEYLNAKKIHPESLFILLLNPLDIKDIASQTSISGAILYEDEAGERHEVLKNVTISKENFKVIYFDEVPVSLSATK